MKKQLDIFFTAVMFLTRIPVPARINHGQDMLQKSARYFSWIGLLVGLITAGSLVVLKQLLPLTLSVALAMIISILITGAFHEDGFADVCDGFGGGWTKEKILLIMKDSRLGTYGVIGLVSVLVLKFILLFELAGVLNKMQIILIICAGYAVSRFSAVTIMQQYEYVSDAATGKSKPLAGRKLNGAELFVAIAGAALPFFFLNPFYALAVVPVIIARLYLGYYFNKWIGGYTGDCLGAMQQVAEISFYLGVFLIWKFT